MQSSNELESGKVKKPTGFLTNSSLLADCLNHKCLGGHRHVQLVGPELRAWANLDGRREAFCLFWLLLDRRRRLLPSAGDPRRRGNADVAEAKGLAGAGHHGLRTL